MAYKSLIPRKWITNDCIEGKKLKTEEEKMRQNTSYKYVLREYVKILETVESERNIMQVGR